MVVETITLRTVAKGSNLSVKAISKAVKELGIDVFSMRMKAYGHRGYVNQIKLEDAEKVIAKAVNYKEEPKVPRVSKQEQLKQNGFEIIAETKTNYRLSKDGITFSVGKYCSLEKILEKFEAKSEVKKEVKEEVKKEEEPVEVEEKQVEDIDPVTGIEGVEVEDEFGDRLEDGCDSSFDINTLYDLYEKKDEEKAKKAKEEKPTEVKEEPKPMDIKKYEKFVPEIKKALEKEHPNTEVKDVVVFDKDDDTHYWARWSGTSHSESLGDMETFTPLEEVVIK